MNLIDDDKMQLAQQLVTQITQGDFEAVEQSLESGLRQKLPAEKLKAVWQTLAAQVGVFKEQVGTHKFQIPAAEFVIVSSLSA